MSTKKWACEYCTYENWPATKRCTLCRATKPPKFINDNNPTQEQDIYKIAPLVLSDKSSNDGGGVEPSNNKWACQTCTYLNWPVSIKCTQCLTPRPKAVAVIASNPQDQLKPLSINVNIAEAEGGAKSASQNNSPRTSPNSSESSKSLNNDKNRSLTGMTNKWSCKACTYSNWPKSIKCVLCGTSKGSTFSEAAGSDIICGPSSYDLSSITATTNKDNSIRKSLSLCETRLSPPASSRNSDNSDFQQTGGASASPQIYLEKQDKNKEDEKRLRKIRSRLRESDWVWLNACQGVVDGDSHPVESFLSSGASPSRQLTVEECIVLGRPSAFQAGYSLVHLAIRFHREDILAVLLTASDVASKGKKRVPSHISPDIATEILREISISLRQRKGDFPCYFVTELASFNLPAEIEDLPRPVQKQLFDELLDRDAQKELEVEESVINWNAEVTDRLGSRLYALWNRTAGDCLLDSVLQATWGVFDRDNTLRRALGDSLSEGATRFYPRWKETETMQAQSLFTLEESQWQQDWAILLSLASQPGASLEQIHIFALAHILRRPIIVYGIKFVKSYRGENIGLAKFQGVYLPLLWEPSFCWKVPIVLGYTRGHFTALLPMEADTDDNIGAGANIQTQEDTQISYFPLVDNEGKLLPIHFLTESEIGREEYILRQWLDCFVTDGGLLVALQKVSARPVLVKTMVDEWLDRYRRLAHALQATHPPSSSQNAENSESEGETDDE